MSESKAEKKQDPVARVLMSIFRAALVVALFFYLLYHLTNGFSVEMETQTVRPASEEVELSAVGTVVRDELLVRSDTSGVVNYMYEDGEKVKIGAKLAMVYTGAKDGGAVSRIAEIDKAIELLEASEIDENTTVSDGAVAEREISALLMQLSEYICRGEYREIASGADELLVKSVRAQTILADGEGAGATLSALYAERASLVSTLGGGTETVRSAKAGYFYTHSDGGEGTFDFYNLENLSAAEYRVKLGGISVSETNAVGKLVLSPNWYLLLPVSAEDAGDLKAGNKYDVIFEGDGVRISMKLASKNEGENEFLLVFASNVMPEGFSFDRTQNVSVVTDTVSGYKLPASALRVVDGHVGVYVRSGNNIRFRVVESFYEKDTYVFVRTDTEGVTLYGDDTDETNDIYCKGLSLYDNVIVGGAQDLTPDRIVN